MENTPTGLLGTWKVASGDRQDLEKTIAAQRESAEPEAVRQMEAALEHWKKLELRIDPQQIVGDLGDGTPSHRYAVKGQWTAADGLRVVDLELQGKGGARMVSVLFLTPNKVLFQSAGLRLPLQRG